MILAKGWQLDDPDANATDWLAGCRLFVSEKAYIKVVVIFPSAVGETETRRSLT